MEPATEDNNHDKSSGVKVQYIEQNQNHAHRYTFFFWQTATREFAWGSKLVRDSSSRKFRHPPSYTFRAMS